MKPGKLLPSSNFLLHGDHDFIFTPLPREASTYDEVSMEQSLLFSDSLKDLKNLRSQLYSAAEYFELSYTNDDQKTDSDGDIERMKRLIEVSGTELRVSCIETVGETMNGGRTKSKYQGRSLDDEDDWHQFRNAVRATIIDTPSSSFR
ncbi:Protein ABIL3 [Vitis vinifera]|uniref:Protein ABIL3 n=1 Tax=Vitis vinifera TaxID=29760 RepID=A0A438BU24_VITVI|nr:Protein ABIL3 [Vitis vinifera]